MSHFDAPPSGTCKSAAGTGHEFRTRIAAIRNVRWRIDLRHVAGDESALGSVDLLRLLQAGDGAAAEALFERYAERLTRLARSRLAINLASRVDPEDIVQSAYRSFFVAAREGRFHAERGGDLWRLLVEVTLHKLYRQAAHHAPSGDRWPAKCQLMTQPLLSAAEPSPDERPRAEELETIPAQLPRAVARRWSCGCKAMNTQRLPSN
jgi:DNA-directed RNA polymerase specialized sigma24 family protein